ncbi:hypothetical protein WCT80_09650 [Pectobacterium carotovorum]|uniref:hypothetical protein n=1 Tax=Pectobacterium carotovorum TaxID=554 RepID=UPI00301A06D6
MTTLTSGARLPKSRIEEIKNGSVLLMGESKNLAATALHFIEEFDKAVVAFRNAAQGLLVAEAQLAELRGQEPVAWIVGSEEIDEFKRGREVTVMRDGDEEELEKIALYIRPAPQAVSPGPVGIGGVTAEHQRVIEMLLKVCGAAFELADDTCECELDGEQCITAPSDSFAKLSDALDEIENTLPTEDADRPDVFLAWAAMPRAALKSLFQLSGNSEQVKEYPDKLPCDVHLVPGLKIGKGCPVSTLHGALLRRAEFVAELDAMNPDQRQAHDKAIADFKSDFLPNSPVIPDGSVPEGYALVPIEPTEAMLLVLGMTGLFDSMIAKYQKALAAAPQPKGE